ncbi:hypothetical protein PFICI_10290 [Pestalotiopsis fici W106-1]|uniref:Uncharacterized protein n=1 Tax=Pestalotiopsis fici (strain W106-1 / CGMCC3.15140) TaxID=1229662 RepID=W3WWI8_PESFW|nr:uncharacterized protein PFICI_10290 [Pestalotiopsis fici W106-1]ETS78228.1 hypothetical protein PFICI_10290 [Pestalotiopsis fici W106-1]
MAQWGLSSYLVVVRSLQALATLISAILNGFLLVYIETKKLGPSDVMLVLEIMTCVTLVYTAIVLLVQHTGRRSLKNRDSFTFAFVVGDILFTGLTIGLLSIISRSGVPANCGGLTRSDYKSTDAADNPSQGYDTVRFGSGDEKGELDHFCGLEKGYFFITIALIFSYMATVTMGVLRIAGAAFRRKMDERLATANELVRLESKISRTRTSLIRQSSAPSSPSQEGLGSPRSFGSNRPPRRDIMIAQQQQQQQQHQHQQQQSPTQLQHHQQEHIQHAQAVRTSIPVSPLTITTTSTPIDPAREGLLIDHHHHHRHQTSVDSIEGAAEAAMITDGYRGPAEQNHHHQHHQHNALAHSSMISSAPPPYVPGESSRFMTGHTADESNEMRLSDYVKGQTRAQDMKDGGAGL